MKIKLFMVDSNILAAFISVHLVDFLIMSIYFSYNHTKGKYPVEKIDYL